MRRNDPRARPDGGAPADSLCGVGQWLLIHLHTVGRLLRSDGLNLDKFIVELAIRSSRHRTVPLEAKHNLSEQLAEFAEYGKMTAREPFVFRRRFHQFLKYREQLGTHMTVLSCEHPALGRSGVIRESQQDAVLAGLIGFLGERHSSGSLHGVGLNELKRRLHTHPHPARDSSRTHARRRQSTSADKAPANRPEAVRCPARPRWQVLAASGRWTFAAS